MNEEVFRAKAQIIAAFASGPAIMIVDDIERDARIASMLALVEMEAEVCQLNNETMQITTKSTLTSEPRPITSIAKSDTSLFGKEIHMSQSNVRLRWGELVEWLRTHPNSVQVLRYDRHHTAIVTASRQREYYRDIDFMVEKDGLEGVLTLTKS
jgi:hypothetical protein